MAELPTFDTARPARVKSKMRPQSCKAKGRRLQQYCATALKEAFTFLQGNDVRSLSMGAAGDDLILSPAALAVLPYNFEMKNVETLSLWSTLEQVLRRYYLQDQGVPTYPCVVLKRNHADAVAVLPLGHLINRLAGEPLVHPMLTTTHLHLCWAHLAIHCAWAQGRSVICHEKSKLNFWATWNKDTLLLFNRGDSAYTIFIALPFTLLVEFLRQSYQADPKLPGLALKEQNTCWKP
jgi:hypothetical protein